jgi:hypothetical protein
MHLAAAIVLSALVASHPPAQEAHQHDGKLGTVKFANSCAPAVQADFGRGMALLHSFEFGPAIDAFALVIAGDSSCGIALWGTAVAHWANPFSAVIRPAPQLQAGRAALERGTAAGA